jgi:hypothetical protein
MDTGPIVTLFNQLMTAGLAVGRHAVAVARSQRCTFSR